MFETTPTVSQPRAANIWSDLPLDAWRDTYATLHLWTQIVGKIKLAQSPMCNHWWQVSFFVTARGLTTSLVPYGARAFQIDFDFIDHELRIETDTGDRRSVALAPRPVADFYRDVMSSLRSLNIEVPIWTTPVELAERIPFEQDYKHSSYDREYAGRFWQILTQVDRVMKVFRGLFVGKASPVHFFWGSFDLAVTRFSGRTAPDHPGGANVARYVMREAYSHECSSCGFWPGAGFGQPAFYSYAYPEPQGMRDCPIQPKEAFYSQDIGEFILPYDAVRTADSPADALLAFFQSTYVAAADAAHWDRAALERTGQPIGAQSGVRT
jgi:hypothetical protein